MIQMYIATVNCAFSEPRALTTIPSVSTAMQGLGFSPLAITIYTV